MFRLTLVEGPWGRGCITSVDDIEDPGHGEDLDRLSAVDGENRTRSNRNQLLRIEDVNHQGVGLAISLEEGSGDG